MKDKEPLINENRLIVPIEFLEVLALWYKDYLPYDMRNHMPMRVLNALDSLSWYFESDKSVKLNRTQTIARPKNRKTKE